MDEDTRKAVDIVWNYMLLHENVASYDCMIILGSRDDRVAVLAAKLASAFKYDQIVVTGGIAHEQDMLETSWKGESEADHFASVMRKSGYKGDLLLEQRARNTGQNAVLSHALLKSIGYMPKNLLLVTKPYMERRAKATFEKQWPEPEVSIHVTSQAGSFDDYISSSQPAGTVINIMVGDLLRIIEYPKLGYQSYQVVPAEVHVALSVLFRQGFVKHVPK